MEALRGAGRSTPARARFRGRRLSCRRQPSRLCCCQPRDCLRRLAQPGESRFRIRSESAPNSHHRSKACGLPSTATHAPLPTYPGFTIKHSWHLRSCSLHILTAKRRWPGYGRLGGRTSRSRSRGRKPCLWNRVTAGYFTVLGNPIVKGRGISELDTTASRNVAIVNEAFARKFFKNEDPIGKHFGRADTGDSRQYEIVGIAKNARYLTFNYDKPIGPSYFLPEAQHDLDSQGKITDSDVSSHFLRAIVIVTKPGASLSSERLRQAMASVDPNLPIISIRTLKEQVAFQFTQQRLIARLTSSSECFRSSCLVSGCME